MLIGLAGTRLLYLRGQRSSGLIAAHYNHHHHHHFYICPAGDLQKNVHFLVYAGFQIKLAGKFLIVPQPFHFRVLVHHPHQTPAISDVAFRNKALPKVSFCMVIMHVLKWTFLQNFLLSLNPFTSTPLELHSFSQQISKYLFLSYCLYYCIILLM